MSCLGQRIFYEGRMRLFGLTDTQFGLSAHTVTELQGTAEGDAFDRTTMNQLVDLADAGIRELIRLQKQALGLAA